MQSSYTFELDGESFRVDGESVTRSLSDYLHALGLQWTPLRVAGRVADSGAFT